MMRNVRKTRFSNVARVPEPETPLISNLLMWVMPKRNALIAICLCCIATVFWSCASSGSNAKNLFYQAESCSRDLQNSPSKMKYRSCWIGCIQKFEAVYANDPSGPWAAAGLYQMGSLYEGLYRYSRNNDDLHKAKKYYQRIVSEFPKSGYRPQAEKALGALPLEMQDSTSLADVKKKYFEAESEYAALLAHPDKQKFRSYWTDAIQKFDAVYQMDPSGPWAAAGLFMMGTLYEDLYRNSFRKEDKQAAEEIYEKIRTRYPDSAYCKKAEGRLKGDIQSVIAGADNGKQAEPAALKTSEPGDAPLATAAAPPKEARDDGMTTVTGIRYWSNPDYTRVVIDADRTTAFQNNLLKKDPSAEKAHQRLYVDLMNSRLGDIEKNVPINDSLLQAARAGQFTADTVRVVIDINDFEDYHIFSLPNPFRIVIDVRGGGSSPPEAHGDNKQPQPNAVSIARQLALGVGRIVIDPGHGGKDYGAPGYLKGVHEKQVVLAIAKKLAEKIPKELGCDVVLTREKDEYLTLEERTAIANMKKGDLFVSIHANASRNQRASGIETYFLNLTADDESITVAARENATSEKNISELQTILNDLLQNAKINESSRLATYVQKKLCEKMASKYNRINNKGVKQAPFYVLMGAQMPAILVETSFISNKTECQRLMDPAYQNALCDGIISGLRQYIKETQPTAFFGAPDAEPGG